MSQAPSMPIFTDALIGDTTHLSIEEFGAYCMLLFVTWRNNGQPLVDDNGRLARTCRVSRRRWEEKIRPALERFFQISDGLWRQKRLEKEWQFVAEQRAKNAARGAAGARAKWLKNNDTPHATSNAQAMAPHTQPYNTPQTPQGGLSRKMKVEGDHRLPTEEPWEQRCASWADKGFWLVQWGPKPDEPGCLAPPDVAAAAVRRRRGDQQEAAD